LVPSHKQTFSHFFVFAGDVESTAEAILTRAVQRFNLHVPAQHVSFVFLRQRAFVEAAQYPWLTMLGQSLGSLVLGWEALAAFAPDILLDTMGYAFVLPLFRFLGGCQVWATQKGTRVMSVSG
jgi:alpha-1,2-mannosyltransferase